MTARLTPVVTPDDEWEGAELSVLAEAMNDVPTTTVGVTDPVQANRARAGFALEALLRYAARVGGQHDGVVTVMRDLLNDLHHLADAAGADWDEVTEMTHYHEETGGEL
ncbi:hypothetical protein K8O93_00995 [Gordonia bronchialis]|uniref:hypothetical protein n=1 Tax=Gordonia bronchialis TaxID=2054 RepID=UPI001CC00F46|nr:hypothetical protein [Gordonia bronchialis]UAK38410.1 hypothetical protein K8O93_00995 [Gordonia bronchialis]